MVKGGAQAEAGCHLRTDEKIFDSTSSLILAQFSTAAGCLAVPSSRKPYKVNRYHGLSIKY
jgi:hypothetical protein